MRLSDTADATSGVPSATIEPDPRRWWSLAVLCMTLLVIGLDNTILNVALPSLVVDLGATTSQLQWIVDGYTLVFAGLLLTAGSLGDRFGRRGALSIGLAIFGIGSLASAVAGGANMLIFTRAFMGIGGALIMPATLSLLTNIFTDPKERARAIGAWAAVAGAGSAFGPLIGGFLLEHFWWGSVFLINVPVVIVALVAGRLLLPTSKDPSAPRLDPVGAVLSMTGLIALLFGIIEAPSKGWSDPIVLAGIGAGAALLIGFVLWELRTSHPMLDVRFFQNRRFTAANAAITLTFFAMFGVSFLATQYLQSVLGFSPLEAGIRMLPMPLTMLVVAPLSPRIVEKVGTKLVVGTGLTLAAIGTALLSLLPVENGYPVVVGAMMIMAAGMGLVMAPATESIMGSLPPAKAGVGSAMNDTTRQMGGALGVAIIGSVLASSYRPGVSSALGALDAPQQVIDVAEESITGAMHAAAQLPAPLGDAVAAAASSEFVTAMHGAVLVGAVVLLVAAGIVFKWLPARAADVRESVEGPLDGIASLTFAEAEGAVELAEIEAEAQPSSPGSAASGPSR